MTGEAAVVIIRRVTGSNEQGRNARLLEVLCSAFGHRWTPWERPLRLVETCRCARCGHTRTRRLGLV